MTATAAPANIWTVAYRKPRANRFLRVDDLALTWDAAVELANRLGAAHPELQVYYVPTRAAEDAGYVAEEDIANISTDTGRRVQIMEGGELPADVAPETPAVAPGGEKAAATGEYFSAKLGRCYNLNKVFAATGKFTDRHSGRRYNLIRVWV